MASIRENGRPEEPARVDGPPQRAEDATLVLGGARSGKSARALSLAQACGPRRLFVATGVAFDDEMADRIARHRAERGAGWQSLECPLALSDTLKAQSADACDVMLVDCLTVWLGNLMHHELAIDPAVDELLAVLAGLSVPLILVSNEVGFGLVPETPLGRRFRDEQGRLNQRIAAVCERVELVIAGLPIVLKR